MHWSGAALTGLAALLGVGCLRGTAVGPPGFPFTWTLAATVFASDEPEPAKPLTPKPAVRCTVDTVTASFALEVVPGDFEFRGAPRPGVHRVSASVRSLRPGLKVDVVREPRLSAGADLRFSWDTELRISDTAGKTHERLLLIARPDGTCASAPLRPE